LNNLITNVWKIEQLTDEKVWKNSEKKVINLYSVSSAYATTASFRVFF